MRRFVLLALLALPAPAQAFTTPVRVIGPVCGQTAAAVSESGAAVIGCARGTGRDESAWVVWRGDPAGPWITATFGAGAVQVRDVQAQALGDGDGLVAYARRTRVRQAVEAVAVPSLRVQRFAVVNASSANVRLARLRDGTVLLAFRDGGALRVAVRGPAATRFGAPRTVVARGAGSFAIAPTGSSVTIVWLSPIRDGRRSLTARTVDRRGRATGRTTVVSHDAGAPRLAGAPDGRAIASWLRRRNGVVEGFTRSLDPLRPARPLGQNAPYRPPAVALGPDDTAVAGAIDAQNIPFGFAPRVWSSRFGGVWATSRRLAPETAYTTDARPVVLPSGEALAIWSGATRTTGEIAYDVLVSRRAPGAREWAPATPLGARFTASNGAGLSVAQSGRRLLAAWPAPEGGMYVSEET